MSPAVSATSDSRGHVSGGSLGGSAEATHKPASVPASASVSTPAGSSAASGSGSGSGASVGTSAGTSAGAVAATPSAAAASSTSSTAPSVPSPAPPVSSASTVSASSLSKALEKVIPAHERTAKASESSAEKEAVERLQVRKDLLALRVVEARERLVSVQKSLAAAESQSREALALSEETEELEAAVCRAAQRVAALHEALNGDEAALSARLAAQASRLKTLQSDAEACQAAVKAAELIRSAASAGTPVDEAALQQAMVEQQRALKEAAEEHERLVTDSLKERGMRLQKAARRAEAQVAQVRREERRLKVRCVELAETITAKRAEAEAGLARQRKLKGEVEQLRAAVEASEKADSARMQELYAQVRELERGAASILDAQLTNEKSPAVQQIEISAREEERARWKSELERVRLEGRRRIEEAREKGRAQYNDLVSNIERKYLAEFEASMKDIRAKAEADTKACEVLESEIAKATESLKEAEARRAALQLSERSRADAEEVRRKEDIDQLQKKLLHVWSTKSVPSSEILDFLQRLQAAIPYTSAVHRLYESKLQSLKESAPVLQAITRREVLLARVDTIRTSIEESADTLADQQLSQLHRDFKDTLGELEAVTGKLRRLLRDYEMVHGQPFIHRGAPYVFA